MPTARIVLDWLRACIAAFQFLTRLPIPVQINYTNLVFRRSVIFYPLAGCAIGLLLLLAGEGLSLLLPALPAAVLLLGLWIIVTGGLHLDGLMDTADGILSHRSREQMLEIMKDSRVGAMGVIVAVLHLLLKFSLLYTLLEMKNTGESFSGLILLAIVPIWSRWFMTAAIQRWPYARKESGLGSFFQGVSRGHVLISFLVALFTTTAFVRFAFAGDGTVIWPVLICFASVTCIAGWFMAAYMSRKLGGLTGDTYGALNELLEAVLLLGVVVFVIHFATY
ncbi:adenosylcobinamide-GDP ribazoletransferase [Paenibacillus planticolens]|uniref:Adenosylcobinamide-GDP ribazoletransferase n=1 Tax=Paenibacillus planticolens TaxID=2654976 RepID=A0ABX1ZLT8_9BACL|nr:adenosylcobinamide-GDP ribazoletransferase [Paenibacillus planticolens]NOU99912.1 adenosylcobinamide-GDP ribazoletransferase [Paenibacillus planticolens]